MVRKTVEFQKKRAEAGAPTAQYDLAMRYLKGDGVEKNLELAGKWLNASATNGHSQAVKKMEDLTKLNDVSKLLHAQPFRPFIIHCADGGRLAVKHEDFVALAPTGREMIVYQSDGDYQVVDIMLVTRLEVSSRNGTGKSHK